MPRETIASKRQRTAAIIQRLKQEHQDSRISLAYETPFQLLVAVILSAQCTDARVNIVTKPLFKVAPDAQALHELPVARLEEIVHSTGFFRAKARNLKACAQRLMNEHEGEVPDTMEELLALGGVARKTANVVLHHAFSKAEGIAVDTHVHRITRLLGLTAKKTPDQIERDLVRLVDRRDWGVFTHLMIDHGRATCIARRPQCRQCVLADLCPSSDTDRTD